MTWQVSYAEHERILRKMKYLVSLSGDVEHPLHSSPSNLCGILKGTFTETDDRHSSL